MIDCGSYSIFLKVFVLKATEFLIFITVFLGTNCTEYKVNVLVLLKLFYTIKSSLRDLRF